jgi:hypothetical protein
MATAPAVLSGTALDQFDNLAPGVVLVMTLNFRGTAGQLLQQLKDQASGASDANGVWQYTSRPISDQCVTVDVLTTAIRGTNPKTGKPWQYVGGRRAGTAQRLALRHGSDGAGSDGLSDGL